MLSSSIPCNMWRIPSGNCLLKSETCCTQLSHDWIFQYFTNNCIVLLHLLLLLCWPQFKTFQSLFQSHNRCTRRNTDLDGQQCCMHSSRQMTCFVLGIWSAHALQVFDVHRVIHVQCCDSKFIHNYLKWRRNASSCLTCISMYASTPSLAHGMPGSKVQEPNRHYIYDIYIWFMI